MHNAYKNYMIELCGYHTINQQEAQLSQRGRAMLRVIQYFSKSLKIM